MSPDLQITDEAYDPGDEIAESLGAVFQSTQLEDMVTQEHEVMGQKGRQQDFVAVYQDDEIEIHETQSVVGILLSSTGPVGLSAAYVLASALKWGEPTLMFSDDRPPGTKPGQYQDLSAEWYRPEAVDAGVADSRIEQLGERYEALDIDLFEDLASVYLD